MKATRTDPRPGSSNAPGASGPPATAYTPPNPAGSATATAADPEAPKFALQASRQFSSWMGEQKLSLAFTTYQSGKLFLIGLNPEGQLSVFERTFERCMGLVADGGDTLWMSTLYQLWRFENAVPPGQETQGYDKVFVPQAGYTTGDIDIHDITVGPDKRPTFVSTLFSCLGAPSESHSFKPLWRPPFITRLAAEDRCHLNGLATDAEGRPRYATAVSESDLHEGWREKRRDGGVVIDVESGETVVSELSMPHSPRLVGEDKLYLLNSGSGHFGVIDLSAEKKAFEPLAFLPGYARGLALAGAEQRFAVIGLSHCRDNRTFQDLPLNDTLAEQKAETRCGLFVLDREKGDVLHSLTLEGVVRELYDVAVLPGVRRPSALGFRTDEIRRVITLDELES